MSLVNIIRIILLYIKLIYVHAIHVKINECTQTHLYPFYFFVFDFCACAVTRQFHHRDNPV